MDRESLLLPPLPQKRDPPSTCCGGMLCVVLASEKEFYARELELEKLRTAQAETRLLEAVTNAAARSTHQNAEARSAQQNTTLVTKQDAQQDSLSQTPNRERLKLPPLPQKRDPPGACCCGIGAMLCVVLASEKEFYARELELEELRTAQAEKRLQKEAIDAAAQSKRLKRALEVSYNYPVSHYL